MSGVRVPPPLPAQMTRSALDGQTLTFPGFSCFVSLLDRPRRALTASDFASLFEVLVGHLEVVFRSDRLRVPDPLAHNMKRILHG